MKLVKLVSKKNPSLKLHKYILAVHDVTVSKAKAKKKATAVVSHTKYHYALNRAEVRQLVKKVKPGSVVDVYLAQHKFQSSWGKGI